MQFFPQDIQKTCSHSHLSAVKLYHLSILWVSYHQTNQRVLSMWFFVSLVFHWEDFQGFCRLNPFSSTLFSFCSMLLIVQTQHQRVKYYCDWCSRLERRVPLLSIIPFKAFHLACYTKLLRSYCNEESSRLIYLRYEGQILHSRYHSSLDFGDCFYALFHFQQRIRPSYN